MSGLGVKPWTETAWDAYEVELNAAGYYVQHCAHCDRPPEQRARELWGDHPHPTCLILPIPGRKQGPCPKPDEPRVQRTAA